MAYELDAELLEAVTARSGSGAMLPPPAARDGWKAVREFGETALAGIELTLPEHPEVTRTDYWATSFDGAEVGLRWYTPEGHDPSGSGPAALFLHGGGMIAGSVALYDRNTAPDPALVPFAGWSYDDNHTGWHALLGEKVGGEDVPGSAAPARAADLAGLAPAYVEVGELDIFRNESIEYARRLAAAGTSVELHVHPGCPHGFDRIAADVDVVRRSRADRMRALNSY